MPQRPRHPEVDQERTTGFESNEQILAAALDRADALADELARDDLGVERPHEPWIEDRHALDRAALEHRGDAAADGLDLGELGHTPS